MRAYRLSAVDEPAMRLSAAPTKSRLLRIYPRTVFASLDHSHWSRCWLERAGLALAERGSLRPCAPFFGDRSGTSARPRWWQLIQGCRHNAARPKRVRDLPHRETWSRLAAICDTSHTEMRKVLPRSCAPAELAKHSSNEPTASRMQRLTIANLFFYEVARCK